jgi:hypothetical protein
VYFYTFAIASPWKRATPSFEQTWNPSPKDDLCQVWLKLAQWFWRSQKCKCLQTDEHMVRQTDGQHAITIAQLSFQLRWAKNGVGRSVKQLIKNKWPKNKISFEVDIYLHLFTFHTHTHFKCLTKHVINWHTCAGKSTHQLRLHCLRICRHWDSPYRYGTGGNMDLRTKQTCKCRTGRWTPFRCVFVFHLCFQVSFFQQRNTRHTHDRCFFSFPRVQFLLESAVHAVSRSAQQLYYVSLPVWLSFLVPFPARWNS